MLRWKGKRGRAGGGGHGDGGSMRWLLTYSDLITLLMVFFVVLYSTSRVDAEKYKQVSAALKEYLGKNPPKAAAGAPPPNLDLSKVAGPPIPPPPVPGDQLPAKEQPPTPPAPPESPSKDAAGEPPPPPKQKPPDPMQKLGNQINNSAALQGKVSVHAGADGLVVSIAGSVLFDPAKATLKPTAAPVLSAIAAQIKSVGNQVVVQGSTDNIPIKSSEFPSNWELSTARASAVVRFLIDQGVPANRLAAVGYGDTRPSFDNSTAEGRASNERVDILVVKTPLSLAGS